MTIAYLAYPIDLAEGSAVPRLARQAKLALVQRGLAVYDPGSAFRVGPGAKVSPGLRRINNAALAEAGVVLVIAPDGVSSWGVPAEVERAVATGVPVAIVTDRVVTWSMAYSAEESVRLFEVDEVGSTATWGMATGRAALWLAEEDTLRRYSRGLPSDSYTVPGVEVASDTPVQRESHGDTLPVVSHRDDARLPTRTHADDAGLDLHVTGDHTIQPGSFVDIPCGIAVELPAGSWGLLVGRSSTFRKRHLQVQLGVIDCGYRGELFAGVYNHTDAPIEVAHGERLAQLILLPNWTEKHTPGWVEALSGHARGWQGFGSTGV